MQRYDATANAVRSAVLTPEERVEGRDALQAFEDNDDSSDEIE